MRDALFIFFSLLTLGCASGVILSRNPITSAFSLIFTFFGLSALYVLWGATFIAMVQILIYVGAIVVLFVFVVMLLNQSGILYSYSGLTILTVGIASWIFLS